MSRKKRKPLRIGIYVGKFDPIHYGHLLCAEWTRQEFNLDKVLFLPESAPPNKKTGISDAEDRCEMLIATVADNPYFDVSRVGLQYKGTSYTLLSVEAIRREYGKHAELFLLLSTEYIDPDHRWYLKNWVGGNELFKQCTVLTFPRDRTDMEQARQWAELIPEAGIQIVDVPSPPLSSTLIRGLVEQGRSIWYTTPWVTQQMIAKKQLYGAVGDTSQCACNCHGRSKIKRVGIYRSEFDPVNYGNLMFAEWARQELNLDRVLFVTSANPPVNQKNWLSAEVRHEMVVAAVAENPHFEASRLDLDRNTASYALLTAEQVREQYGEDVELFMLVDADHLNPDHPAYMPTWMGASELFKICKMLMVCKAPEELAQAQAWSEQIEGADVQVIYAPVTPVSQGLIRELVEQKRSIAYTTPWCVRQIIDKKGVARKT